MRQLVIFCTVLFSFTVSAQLPSCVTREQMPYTVQELISSSQKTERIAIFENGEVLYFITGIDSTSYNFRECFLIHSEFHTSWKAVASPSKESGYAITQIEITPNSEIKIVLRKGNENIPATFSFPKGRFIYKSPTDEQKIDPIPYVNLNR